MTQQHDGPSLLPCPFCGGEAQPALIQGGGIEWAQVECVDRGCGAVGPTPATEAEAIAAWNDRPTQPQADDRAEIVRWLRAQSDKGAEVGIAAGKETTRRAAFGGGSLALHRAADAIERGEHLIDNIADRLANGETESQQPQAEGLVEEFRALCCSTPTIEQMGQWLSTRVDRLWAALGSGERRAPFRAPEPMDNEPITAYLLRMTKAFEEWANQ